MKNHIFVYNKQHLNKFQETDSSSKIPKNIETGG